MAMWVSARLLKLYEHRSHVITAFVTIGTMLAVNITVETKPAITGMFVSMFLLC